MKFIKTIFITIMSLAMVLSMTACGGDSTADIKSGVQGEWALYHWYENAEGGEDVFLDDSNFITVKITEDKFEATAADGSLENASGEYTWVKADEAEVVMSDGTRSTIRISANNKKHNKSAVWDVFVVETNMTYCLEETKGTENE